MNPSDWKLRTKSKKHESLYEIETKIELRPMTLYYKNSTFT